MINDLMSKLMQKRIPQIEHYMNHPIEVQDELLKSLLKTAKNTIWGNYYDYKSIRNWQDYNERVPVSDYESLLPFFTRIRGGEDNVLWPSQIKWFSKSSGTTSTKSKFIPISTECLNDCHYKGGKDMLALYCNNKPKNKVFSGMNLALGGSRQENELNSEIFCGDVSAIIIDNLPFWAELYRVPKKEIALMPEWESKLEKMIDTVIHSNVVSLSGVPSWMMVLLKNIEEKTGKRIEELWPDLDVYFHGGVSFVPYRKQFEEILPKSLDFKIGDFSSVTYAKLIPATVIVLISVLILLTFSNELDVLTLGDENAKGPQGETEEAYSQNRRANFRVNIQQ